MPTLKKFSTSVRIYCLVAPNQPLLLNFHLLRLSHTGGRTTQTLTPHPRPRGRIASRILGCHVPSKDILITQTVSAPSEAWRFLQGERPCRTRPNQPFVPSVAMMKETAKVGWRSYRRKEKTSALRKGCQRPQRACESRNTNF